MKLNFYSLLTGLVILTSSAIAQPTFVEKVESEEGKLIIPYEKYTLANGLTIILHEDKADPIVHVNVTYHVGSARETPGKSGFAHFFEHMMFQGSDNVADEEHFKIVQSAGGTMNGTTNRDRTNYFETLPSNYLETALWLEADRMGFLLDAVTKKAFENQRSTVKNEKGQRMLNQPYGTLDEVKNSNLYPQGHPYSWSVIGYTDDLDRADENDLKNFFLRWYGPNNAILTVAGDFEKEETLAMIEKYFGPIKKGPDVKKQRLPRPIIPNDKYSTIEDQIFLPLTQFVWPTVPTYHRDEAPLDMLAAIMGQGNNSIFYKNFVKTEKAIDAFIQNPTSELAGEYQLYVIAYPTESLEETEKLIRSTLTEFETDILTGPNIDDLLAQAKGSIKTDLIMGSESLQGKAAQLSSWQMLLGRPYNLQDELDRYSAVTKEDVLSVYNKYIKGKKAVITNVVRHIPQPGEDDFTKDSHNPYAQANYPLPPEYAGLKYVKAEDSFDRSAKPNPGTPKPAVVPAYYKKSMGNGLNVIGTQTKDLPTVGFYLTIRGGHIMDGNGYQDGTANLTAQMMNEGTESMTTEEVSAALAKLGSEVQVWSDRGSTNMYVVSRTENIDKTLEIANEILTKPRFGEEDFKRVKKQLLESIKNQRTNPALTASKAFSNVMYGNTVLGRYYTGTYQDVDKIKLEDVKKFYAENYAPNLSNLVVVGELEEAEIMSKMSFFESWEKKDVTLPEISNFPKYEGPQILLIDKPAAAQSEIRIGYLAHKWDYKDEYFKSNMMNFALGGSFNSRINLNLREDKGFTYGARSYFSGSEYPGTYMAAAAVRTSSTDSAVVEFMKEINEYRANGITDEELEFTKSAILLSDILNYETSRDKGAFLDRIARYDLPDDYIKQQEEVVNAMTKEEINQIAKDNLKTEEMVILIVGNSYVVKKRLEKLGYGKVKELDAAKINLKEFKN